MRDLPEEADGVRDPFNWSRFRGLKFMLPGVVIAVLVIIGSGRNPESAARGEALRAAQQVTGVAVGLAARLGTQAY